MTCITVAMKKKKIEVHIRRISILKINLIIMQNFFDENYLRKRYILKAEKAIEHVLDIHQL